MIRVALIGIGLIGGSISLCLKKRHTGAISISAYDSNPSQLQLAKSLRVIDHSCASIDDAVCDADFVIICTPVRTLPFILEQVMSSAKLKKEAIVTDVGSTKSEIVQLSQNYLQNGPIFIGGHPMAGSHKSGVEAANERLFENAYYVITPSAHLPQIAIKRLSELLTCTSANIVYMTPEEHDQVVGAISHFPHLIASSLVGQVFDYHQLNDWYLRLAAGGFRDITRIASSNPRMWCDITLSNKQHLIQQLADWQKRMETLIKMLQKGDAGKIEDFFEHAKKVRDGLPDGSKGAIPAFLDLYVDVPDHPGVIGQITTLLGEAKISITNIAILETREDIMGALRLSFRNEEDRQRASTLISSLYQVYERL
jgi:prephenate dehydrogenase